MSVNGSRRQSTGGAQLKPREQYSISSVVTDPSTASALPSLSSLTANSYLSSSLGSLGTSFTPSGLPALAPGTKSVAQRRAVAPALVVGDIRKVDPAEFEPYLHAVTAEYDRWQKENELGRQGAADLSLDGEGIVGLGVSVGPGLGGRANREEALPSLDVVPQIFFDPNFNLGNPRTFDLVTERIQLSNSASTGLSLAPSAAAATAPSPALSYTNSPTLDSVTTKMNRASSGPASDPIPGLGPLTLADLATDQILQEKLSHYTALIESHLVREIGLRSSSFFSALSNLQSLHSQGEECLHKIAELQAALDSDGRGVGGAATRGLKVLRAQARRRGLERIEEGVRVVQEVQEGVEGVKELVEAGEWIGALEVSEQIEQLYFRGAASSSPDNDNQPSTSVSPTSATFPKSRASTTTLNLTKVKALDHVPKRLAALRAQVASALEAELIGILSRELEEGVAEYVRLEGKWKGKGKETSAEEESAQSRMREKAKERVRPGVRGLVRAEGMDRAVAAWRELVLKEVRTRVREHLPTSDAGVNDEEDALGQGANRKASSELATLSDKSLSLAKNLRALSPTDFLALAQTTYLGLLGCIEVTQLHAEVLAELATELREEERLRKARRSGSVVDSETAVVSPPPRSSSLNVPGAANDQPFTSPDFAIPSSASSSAGSEDGAALVSDIADVVHAAAELANVRFSKVVGVRGELHARLDLADFVDVFEASWSFVVACEVICKRMIVGLRGVMVGQAKAFLQTFHQGKVTTSARVVEEEQWSPTDVPRSAQEVVGLIIAAAVQDPAGLLLGERRAANPPQPVDISGPPSKQLSVDDGDFFAVPAVLVTLEVVIEYLKVVINLPSLTTDLMAKAIEFLRAFNSRTCQVVLGAGAMRTAGLKNITAKHLAMASQALSVMVALIPYLRETWRRHLNAKQAVMLVEFDKLRRDFQEHQNEIHAKLVAIMADRLDVHCKALQAVDWEKPVEAGRKEGEANGYVEALLKEHVTLNKVISRYLHQATIEGIMGQVGANLDSRLQAEFGRIEVKSDAAKDRLKLDAIVLNARLAELNGVDKAEPLAEVVAIADGKAVPEPAPPPISRTTSIINLRSPSTVSLGSPQLDAHASLTASPRASLEVPRSSGEAPRPAEQVAALAPAQAAPPPPLARKKTMSERLAEIARRNRPGKAAPAPAVVQEEVVEAREAARVTEVEGRQLPPPPSATPDESQARPGQRQAEAKLEGELPKVPGESAVAAAKPVDEAVEVAAVPEEGMEGLELVPGEVPTAEAVPDAPQEVMDAEAVNEAPAAADIEPSEAAVVEDVTSTDQPELAVDAADEALVRLVITTEAGDEEAAPEADADPANDSSKEGATSQPPIAEADATLSAEDSGAEQATEVPAQAFPEPDAVANDEGGAYPAASDNDEGSAVPAAATAAAATPAPAALFRAPDEPPVAGDPQLGPAVDGDGERDGGRAELGEEVGGLIAEGEAAAQAGAEVDESTGWEGDDGLLAEVEALEVEVEEAEEEEGAFL